MPQTMRKGVPMNKAYKDINNSKKRYLVFWGG